MKCLYKLRVLVIFFITLACLIGFSNNTTLGASSIIASTVQYSQYDFGSGAMVSISIKNNSTTVIQGWTLTWNFSGNQKITNMWLANYKQSGNCVTVSNTDANVTIPANSSLSFGFNITYSGTNAKPTSFILNGIKCDLSNQEALTINCEPDFGSATVSWSGYDSALVQGYQAVLTESSDTPSDSIEIDELIQTPIVTYDNLSAKKVYYVWIRAVALNGNISRWYSKIFSPQPGQAIFVDEESKSTAYSVDGLPEYLINLKVTDVDAAYYVIHRYDYNGSGSKEFDPVDYESLSQADFMCDGGQDLVKHSKYIYSVYTKNALGEASASSNIVIEVKNLAPQECVVTKGWRKLEVNTQLSLQLGPNVDLEGDALEYHVYLRTPGVGNGVLVDTLTPTTENEAMTVDYTFSDKTNYEWLVRCVEKDITGATEVGDDAWDPMCIDTDGIIIVSKNDQGTYSWSTKKQPLSFLVEINPSKTYTDYQWNFGDGSTARGETATHIYTTLTNGTPYQVNVTAVDASGIAHQGTNDIYIINTYLGKLYDNEEWSGTLTNSIEGLVTVPEGLTLTLASGTKVPLTSAGGIQVNGTLQAVDSNDGINFDLQTGSALWQGINFQGNGSGVLKGVTISNAALGLNASSDGTINLDNVIFSNNNIGLDYTSGSVTANQCLFQYNQYGVKVESASEYPTLTNCRFISNTIHYLDSLGEITAEDIDELNQYPNSGNVIE